MSVGSVLIGLQASRRDGLGVTSGEFLVPLNIQPSEVEATSADGGSWAAVATIVPHRRNPKALKHGVRGGSWDYDVVHSLRVSGRGGYPSDLRDATLGFRCAFEPLPQLP